MESLESLDYQSSAYQMQPVKYLYTTATVYSGRSDGRTDGRGIAVSSPQIVAKYPSSYGILMLSRRQDSNRTSSESRSQACLDYAESRWRKPEGNLCDLKLMKLAS